MKIDINDAPHDVRAATLAALLDELGYRDAVVATALNGAFVATADRVRTPLNVGDRVEILAPMQGG